MMYMTPVMLVFIISGLGLLGLLAAKIIENRMRRQLFVLALISKGDIYIRDMYHKMIHLYFDGKENFSFLLEKQIPLHSKNSKNKLVSFLKEKREQYLNNMRDAKLLRKSDGISEFFKSISELERGTGEIHDTIEEVR